MSDKKSISDEKIVSSFLHQYENKRTYRNYQTAIYHFLQAVSDIEKNKPDYLDSAAAEYLKEISAGRNLLKDLICAANRFSGTYSPVSTHLMLHSVTLWLEDCGFSLNRREYKRIFSKLPPAYPIRKEAELTRQMFFRIYTSLSPEWAKVLLLVLLASGMRIGEALALKYDDIAWKKSRAEISVRAEITKTKTARTVYLTKEA
ncbi:MAG TPA: tyrosine-type recombinase/integrase, partial [Methanocorpusculum sp.]|nr:tyrosine-type recombinase/integrase [Methanocorpusculum sp.]